MIEHVEKGTLLYCDGNKDGTVLVIVLKILFLKIVLIKCLLAEERVPESLGIEGRVSTQPL
jgi:hypothetical protein